MFKDGSFGNFYLFIKNLGLREDIASGRSLVWDEFWVQAPEPEKGDETVKEEELEEYWGKGGGCWGEEK